MTAGLTLIFRFSGVSQLTKSAAVAEEIEAIEGVSAGAEHFQGTIDHIAGHDVFPIQPIVTWQIVGGHEQLSIDYSGHPKSEIDTSQLPEIIRNYNDSALKGLIK